MHRVCVFLGSSAARHPASAQAARDVAQLPARQGLGLVHAGARIDKWLTEATET